MNRLLLVAVMIGLLSACSSSGSTASPSPAPTPSGTARPTESAAASVEPSPGPTAAPTIAPTARPAVPATPPPPPFESEGFAEISEEPLSEDTAEEYQSILTEMAADGGIAATVMSPDGTWNGAFGKADGVQDLEVDSQFSIASITKSIVAAQVMQLVDAGEFSLDAPVTDYLPADLTFDTNGATVRQLLNHRSGIPDWYDQEMMELVEQDRDRVWELEEVLARVGDFRLPLGSFHYSDTNYSLLGLAIEHVRERPLADVLRDGVLSVEGTERMIFQPAEAPTDPMAMPSGESREAFEQGAGYLPSISDASSGSAAAAIASDSISLARWFRALCAGEIVSPSSLAEMTAFGGGPDEYGLGLMNPARDVGVAGVGHGGASFGFASWAACLPGEESQVIVVLANRDVDNVLGMPRPLVLRALAE